MPYVLNFDYRDFDGEIGERKALCLPTIDAKRSGLEETAPPDCSIFRFGKNFESIKIQYLSFQVLNFFIRVLLQELVSQFQNATDEGMGEFKSGFGPVWIEIVKKSVLFCNPVV